MPADTPSMPESKVKVEDEAAPDILPALPEADKVETEMGDQQPVVATPPLLETDSRITHWLKLPWVDLVWFLIALVFMVVAVFIWFKPLLLRSQFPYVSYSVNGVWKYDAQLYRPLAMPTRYYIGLPEVVAQHYQWFAVDRRSEIVALATKPDSSVFGGQAIRRGDPLGVDLEFRKIGDSEWQIAFLPEAIVFSNAVLCVRLDTQAQPQVK